MTEVEGVAATTAKDELAEEDQANDLKINAETSIEEKDNATDAAAASESTSASTDIESKAAAENVESKEKEADVTSSKIKEATTKKITSTAIGENEKSMKKIDDNVEFKNALKVTTTTTTTFTKTSKKLNANGDVVSKPTIVIEYNKDMVDCVNVVELKKSPKSPVKQNMLEKDMVELKKNIKSNSNNKNSTEDDKKEKLLQAEKDNVVVKELEEKPAETITVETADEPKLNVNEPKTETETSGESIETSKTVGAEADTNKTNDVKPNDVVTKEVDVDKPAEKAKSQEEEKEAELKVDKVNVANEDNEKIIKNDEASSLTSSPSTSKQEQSEIKDVAEKAQQEKDVAPEVSTDTKENGIASSAEQDLNNSIITVADDDDDDDEVVKGTEEHVKVDAAKKEVTEIVDKEKVEIVDICEDLKKNDDVVVPKIINIETMANIEKDPLNCDETQIPAAVIDDDDDDDDDGGDANVDNNKLAISLLSDSDGAVVINSDSESETGLNTTNNNNNNNNNNSSIKTPQQTPAQQPPATPTLPNITITATKVCNKTAATTPTTPTTTKTTTPTNSNVPLVNNSNNNNNNNNNSNKMNNVINNIDEDDDDDDDCVVIEDETTAPPASALHNHHNNNNGDLNKRKSQLDNGIHQLVDANGNQAPPSKRQRAQNTSPVGSTLTLKDARSLVQPQHKSPQQQQLITSDSGRRDGVLAMGANIFPVNIAASVVTTTNALITKNYNSYSTTLTTTTTTSLSAAVALGNTTCIPKLVPMSSPTTAAPCGPSTSAMGTGYTNVAAVAAANAANTAAVAAANAMLMGTNNFINAAPTPTTATLLPGLTDDMFVLEAPSFIVPYIYEKPPSDSLKLACKEIEMKFKLTREDLADADKSDEFDMMTEQNKDEKSEADAKAASTSTGLSRSTASNNKKNNKKRRRGGDDPDESWSEESSEDDDDDDDDSDAGMRTKVLIKEASDDLTALKGAIKPASVVAQSPSASTSTAAILSGANNNHNNGTVNLTGMGMLPGGSDLSQAVKSSPENYFESPLGKFFMDIGVGLVQEHVQSDLIRLQKRKMRKSLGKNVMEFERAISALSGNLEASRKKNAPFKSTLKRCEFCNFKSESALAMANHYETPHMNGIMYKCNFCTFEIRNATEIVYHMEAMHNIKARLIKPLPYHQCPNCGFEDNGKAKLARHQPVCAKKFRPEVNLIPPSDWEAPAKIPRIKPRHGLVGTATAYQAMAAQAAAQKAALASIQQQQQAAQTRNLQAAAALAAQNAMKIRGRPPVPCLTKTQTTTSININNTSGAIITQNVRGSTQPIRQPIISSNTLPNHVNYPMMTQNTILQQSANALAKKAISGQPSISITPLPRQNAAGISIGSNNNNNSNNNNKSGSNGGKGAIATGAGQSANSANSAVGNNKAQYVICEICDGYIKDLDQLRNHMQWMHKVKIHPKMIYNRPPLNCQKCQFRFFTDQGLERHLLGSHGLVTSSMQEAANKGKDAGRCPVCGRMYQWKLLNHVSREHHMTLKPAHLSYKCTVCTATFGMYKQFETHVYTAHSTVAKKAMDGKKNTNSSNNNNNNSSSSSGSSSNMANSSNSQQQSPMASITNISGVNLSNLAANITAAAAAGTNLLANNQLSRNHLSSGSDALLKPLKINDEITIIPQPSTKPRITNMESHVID